MGNTEILNDEVARIRNNYNSILNDMNIEFQKKGFPDQLKEQQQQKEQKELKRQQQQKEPEELNPKQQQQQLLHLLHQQQQMVTKLQTPQLIAKSSIGPITTPTATFIAKSSIGPITTPTVTSTSASKHINDANK